MEIIERSLLLFFKHILSLSIRWLDIYVIMMITHDHEMGSIYIMQIYYGGVLFLSRFE